MLGVALIKRIVGWHVFQERLLPILEERTINAGIHSAVRTDHIQISNGTGRKTDARQQGFKAGQPLLCVIDALLRVLA